MLRWTQIFLFGDAGVKVKLLNSGSGQIKHNVVALDQIDFAILDFLVPLVLINVLLLSLEDLTNYRIQFSFGPSLRFL